jgi:hypothetical protein
MNMANLSGFWKLANHLSCFTNTPKQLVPDQTSDGKLREREATRNKETGQI